MSKPTVFQFIPTIEAERGKRYVFGAETRFTDASPAAFDCSELVQWGLARVGVSDPPDGARNQFAWCKTAGLTIPIASGIVTFGALLFRLPANHEDHVAVSLGNGSTFEARGRAYGVNEFHAIGRPWTAAAMIPGLDYTKPGPVPIAAPVPTEELVDMQVVIEAEEPKHRWLIGAGVAYLIPDVQKLAQFELTWGKATKTLARSVIEDHAKTGLVAS